MTEEANGGVRDRTVAGGGLLFTRQGYAATTMRGIVKEAGTPWGSVHHYFPGGKEEVAIAAVDLGDRKVRSTITACLTAAGTLSDAVRSYFDAIGNALATSDYELGCPVATVALEQASMDNGISAASRAAMSEWTRMWAEAFTAGGIAADRADELGTMVIVSVEGALLLSRVTRSLQPIRVAAASTAALIDAEVLEHHPQQ